jgi:hypothetical protein
VSSTVGSPTASYAIRTAMFFHVSHPGPTGAFRHSEEHHGKRTTAWGTRTPSVPMGISVLNVDAAEGRACIVSSKQAAIDLHVDDAIVLGDAKAAVLHADSIVDVVVKNLETLGFSVSQVEHNNSLTKAVGYELVRGPASIRFPRSKAALVRAALLELAAANTVDTRLLRSSLGIWIFGSCK